VNRDRDANELAALGAARASGLPILAICRGAQLVNVVYGGTLIPDLMRDMPLLRDIGTGRKPSPAPSTRYK
jgi:gamma-glutamyl-gamma-aminobutyrate hydrolase PuuD